MLQHECKCRNIERCLDIYQIWNMIYLNVYSLFLYDMFISNCRVRVPVLLCSVVMFLSFLSDISLFCWFPPGV